MEYLLPAGIFLGFVLFFVGIYGLIAEGADSVGMRMARYATGIEMTQDASGKRKRVRRRREVDPFATLSSDVEDRRFQTRVQRDLARADLKLRVSEYYYIRIGLMLGLGLALFVLRDPISGVIGAILGYFGPRFWVGRRIGGRLGAFNKQLPDTITLLSSSLRAGSSFLQSIELVAREGQAPMAEEMGRIVREVNLGLGMEEALQNLVRRIKSDDLDLMVTAINIQQQVGGNLAEVLDTIAFTIRERVRIKGDINTLTAQGRISGYLVAGLPVALGAVLNVINPAFMEPLFTQDLGRILIVAALISMGVGFFTIRKITDIKV